MTKNNHVTKTLDKTMKEIEKYLKESKSKREQTNFKRKQLQFLKADVAKPKLPFKRILLKLDRKKARKIKNSEKKRNNLANS